MGALVTRAIGLTWVVRGQISANPTTETLVSFPQAQESLGLSYMEDERQIQQHFELLQSKECMEPTDRFLKLHRKCIYIWLTLFSGSEKIWQCFRDQGVFTSLSNYSPLILDIKLFWSGSKCFQSKRLERLQKKCIPPLLT